MMYRITVRNYCQDNDRFEEGLYDASYPIPYTPYTIRNKVYGLLMGDLNIYYSKKHGRHY